MLNLRGVFSSVFLVLRRHVSAERRTIVFSTVRPSLQQIIDLSKKSSFLYVQWNYNTKEPCPSHRLSVCLSVRLSVCRHLGAQLCTDECSVILRWILFSFGTWKEHILEVCLGVLFLKKSQKLAFWRFFVKWWFWGLSVIIDGSLYGQVLGYPSMDFIFLWSIDRTYIGAVHRRIIFEKCLKW